MWGSALIEVEDIPHDVVFEEKISIMQKSYSFAPNGDGWFEAKTGTTADALVKRLRKARRHNKDAKGDIDALIGDIRMMKALEAEMTIRNLSWGTGKEDAIKGLGLSDRSLKHLRQFGESRSVSLQKACLLWQKAEATLKMLDEHEDVWGTEEQQAWANAMLDRMKAAEIRVNMDDAGIVKKSYTDKKFSMLLSLYGEEYDIIKGAQRGTYVRITTDGLVMKDAWAYGAGFLDADGYITITERGEPRAGLIATGDRGRTHCEDLYKTLDCGVLQLDSKVYHKASQRSQHRLQFYSKADLRKFLTGVLPHLRMKSTQAKAVLAFIDEKDATRKQELKRLVRYENWKDHTKKSTELLNDWGIDADTIGTYAEGL